MVPRPGGGPLAASARHYARTVPSDPDRPAEQQPAGEPAESSGASAVGGADTPAPPLSVDGPADRFMPRWVIRAIILFWTAFLVVGVLGHLWDRLSG